ncbi:DUF362 domain-containing protein [Planctomycetota bacterium]
MKDVATIEFTDYPTSVPEALDAVGAAPRLPSDGLIILKPNLTNADGPPVTTPVGIVEAAYRYCAAHTNAEIAIGEGCGTGETIDTFESNGYVDLAEREGIRLIDFNKEEAVRLERDDTLQLKELYLPKVALDAFIISIPILKDHSFTVTTIAMKNMFGLAPAPYYEGSWNKSKLHTPCTHRSVVDVCLYKPPGLCLVDAVTALAGMHLHGTPKNLGLILAGFDPVAVDAAGSRLMGHDPDTIEYLMLARSRDRGRS